MEDVPQPKVKPPGKKKPPAEEPKSELQRHREYVMGRLDIFTAAHNALKHGKYSQSFEETIGLAEFLAGDHI